ncbi:NAD-dependent epimerase/dehydratase family protein [Maribellus sp. YY47]|uniref:NAD-dependent epimerase/dehydratase family protein n=1 Tax=Maribellus sp. YY47 TaxID=2929486 RepID=UPI002001774F|nr:NAD-dependent epimerase/dehydratase family protein [Maribellus sp. YY47]MCK3684361.1 NAD-dependent epimerase/dehydratase family protein [Maribellus sp. YY47]
MNKEQAYQNMLQPSQELINDILKIEGDIILLGAGGKMGPDMARLTKKAIDLAGINKKVTAVSRFSEESLEKELNVAGIQTIKADLLNENDVQNLPDTQNVIFLAGHKFGTTGNEPYTWVMNTYLPGRIANKYKNSRIVVFSSGNIYPFSPIEMGGVTEDVSPSPIGEYAQSCLGRERIFQYFASKNNTPLLIYRLNYANDVTYGVLLEIAKSVFLGKSIDLSMGNVNVIWQADANEIALRSLLHCSVPTKILNVTGPETISVRWVASKFGEILKKEPVFNNIEQPKALLSNAAECFKLFGYPRVSLNQMIELIAKWVIEGGKTNNKPTHFQEREGKF